MAKPTGKPRRPDLRVVAEAEVYDLMRRPESTADRVKRLQIEARALALEEIEMLERALLEASRLAAEVAAGGDAYPVGARELASRIAADLPAKAETLRAIASRTSV